MEIIDNQYYEIEYDSRPIAGVEPIPNTGRFVLKSQSITPPTDSKEDKIRKIFFEMRGLARTPRVSGVNQYGAELFYKQGMFMKGFTDEYSGNIEFSQYYPSYQMMGYEQLRAYFTWRTQVRCGNICDTSLSYAFVYIYELLNNIGVDNPVDGLKKLQSFWKSFRVFDTTIDKYLSKWQNDYYDYYDLPLSDDFKEDSLYDSNSLDEWNNISSYDITKSKFYNDGNEELTKNCFEFIICELKKQVQFKKRIFAPIKFDRDPFNGAIFFNQLNKSIQMERQFVTDNGKQLVGSITKQMEVTLRKLTKYKYKIKPPAGNGLNRSVDKFTQDYYDELNRIKVKVDFSNLKQIRKEALGTQEKLIVSEEQEVPQEEIETIETPASDFNEIELKALSVLLHDEDIKQFADKHEIMLEVLIDSINEKAVDLMGDNLIDEDCVLYDDYVDKVKELVV